MRCGDTSFFIDLFDPDRAHHADATQWYESHADQPFFVPAIVNWELYRGAVRVSDEYVQQLQGFLEGVEPLPLTDGGAYEAARIEKETRDEGVQLAKADCLIAGIVREVGGTLITADRDFDRVEELRCEHYVGER